MFLSRVGPREHLLALLQHEEAADRVEPAAAVVRHVPLPQARHALRLRDVREGLRHAPVAQRAVSERLLVLHADLDGLDGHRHERVEEPGDERGADKGAHRVVRKVAALHEPRLALVIEANLRHADNRRAEDGRVRAAPVGQRALLAVDAGEGIVRVLVAAALIDGRAGVGLHADHGDVDRAADERGKAPADGAGEDAVENGGLLLLAGLEADDGVTEHVVAAEAGRRVDHLAGDARAEAVVHAEEAAVVDDALERGHQARVEFGLHAHLHADLDHVHRVDNGPGDGAAERRDGEVPPLGVARAFLFGGCHCENGEKWVFEGKMGESRF